MTNTLDQHLGVLTAVSILAYMWFGATTVLSNRRDRRAEIVISPVMSQFGLMSLRVMNSGKSSARDIRFSVLKFPSLHDGGSPSDVQPFRNGIITLPSGQSLYYDLAAPINWDAAVTQRPIVHVVARYKTNFSLCPRKAAFKFDLSDYRSTTPDSWRIVEVESVRALEEIAKALRK